LWIDCMISITMPINIFFNLASDRMKARYNHLANAAGFQEGDQVWLYFPTGTRGKSSKIQPSCECLNKVIT
jgi:hypothetical protein